MNVSDRRSAAYGTIALDETGVFQLWRRVFIPAVGIFVLVHFPARLAAHMSMSRSGLRDYWSHPAIGVVVANLLLFLSFVLVEGALISYVAPSDRREPSVEEALRRAFSRFPQLVLARLLYFAAVGCGLVLFVVPGIIVALLFSMHAWVIVAEHASAVTSLRRSSELVRGRMRQTFRQVLPATFASLTWLAIGFTLVGLLLRVIRPFPIFKLAPLAMTIVETGIVLPILAVGLLYYRYRSNAIGA